MHQRPNKNKSTSHPSGSKGKPNERPSQQKSKMLFRRSVGKSIVSWLYSFTQLFVIIGIFVALVYVYDKRILYGFAREAGWIHSVRNSPQNLDNNLSGQGLGPGKEGQENKKVQGLKEALAEPPDLGKENMNISPTQSVGEETGKGDEQLENILYHKKINEDKLETGEDYEKDESEDRNIFTHHVLQVLTNSHTKPHLKTRFDVCIRSILRQSSLNLHFFFVVDKPSQEFIMEALQDATDDGISKSKFQFTFLNIDDLGHDLAPYVTDLQTKLSGTHPYYRDTIFYLSLGIHHRGVLPSYVKQIVILDTDLKFMSDIKLLFEFFNDFADDNVMAIAHEQQPVYRHLFSLYRSQNKGTIVGDPPPNGLTGFNSGVMLIDIERMRKSKLYKEVLTTEFIDKYANKYHFKGHLGDQDFFSLVSMERNELFYILPCSWNKQLCIWWKDKGYKDVFDLYFNCPDPIHVYHGNCNTNIPY